MTRRDSNRIRDHFAASARDLTPAFARHSTRLLYARFSGDPELSGLCTSILSEAELWRASRFASVDDRDAFVQRRAFRRFCAALALGTSRPLPEIDFEETDNGRPYLLVAPNLEFSFSSCRSGMLGAWSSTHAVGVDVEEPSRDLDALALAHEFFSRDEAGAVARLRGTERQRTFYRLWCLKEAALKSIGEGLPFGLAAFAFDLCPRVRVIDAPAERGGPEQFWAHEVATPGMCIAVVTCGMQS